MGALKDHLTTIPKKSTKRNYQAALFDYCDILFGKQRAGNKATLEEVDRYDILVDRLITGYKQGKREYFLDMQRYYASLHNRITPMAGRNYITCVRTFFLYQRIELTTADWRLLKPRLPKGGARTEEDELDHEVLRSILSHGDARLRALVLVMASSGMRLNETLSLTLSDIKLDTKPAEIWISGEITKTGDSRMVFITEEGKKAVKEWLKERDAYIKLAWARTTGFSRRKIMERSPNGDDRLFPFTNQTACLAWENAVRKTGSLKYDPKTKRATLHLHMLRKFFRSNLGLHAKDVVVESLMGHAGYLGGSYRRLTRDQLRQAYLKAEYALTIMGDTVSSEKIASIARENEELRKKVAEIEKQQEENARVLDVIQALTTMPGFDAAVGRAQAKMKTARQRQS